MNVFDYLLWRGDLELSRDPLNDIDNLILSQLSYINFTGIVSASFDNEPVLIADAAAKYASSITEEQALAESQHDIACRLLLTKMSKTKRFGQCTLTGYRKIISRLSECQFAVVTIVLPDGSQYVSFSGTDGSLVGWKENFNMLYMAHVPGQQFALDYLTELCSKTKSPINVGGHSKGGNLAVYASMHLPQRLQAHIGLVYNNDGPGFPEDVIHTERYFRIRDKVRTIIPECSVVGLLMEHESRYSVVKSSAYGIEQHSVFTWQVLGNELDYADHLDKASLHLEQLLDTWLSKIDKDQRKLIVDRLFEAFDKYNITSSDNLSHMNLRTTLELLHDIQHLDPEHASEFQKIVKLYLASYSRLTAERKSIKENSAQIRTVLLRTRKKVMHEMDEGAVNLSKKETGRTKPI